MTTLDNISRKEYKKNYDAFLIIRDMNQKWKIQNGENRVSPCLGPFFDHWDNNNNKIGKIHTQVLKIKINIKKYKMTLGILKLR